MQVRHYERDASTWYHPKILLTIQKYLEIVCDQLHFDSAKLQFGFWCHGSFDVGDHIAILDSINDSLPSELKCSKSPNHKTRLGDSHKAWFEKVSLYALPVCAVYLCIPSLHVTLFLLTYAYYTTRTHMICM